MINKLKRALKHPVVWLLSGVSVVFLAGWRANSGFQNYMGRTSISQEELTKLEKAASVPEEGNIPKALAERLKGLSPESRELLALIKNSQEGWPANLIPATQKAASPLIQRQLANELKTQEELKDAGFDPNVTKYGVQLINDGPKVHDQMVQVLATLLDNQDKAGEWIRVLRREPSKK